MLVHGTNTVRDTFHQRWLYAQAGRSPHAGGETHALDVNTSKHPATPATSSCFFRSKPVSSSLPWPGRLRPCSQTGYHRVLYNLVEAPTWILCTRTSSPKQPVTMKFSLPCLSALFCAAAVAAINPADRAFGRAAHKQPVIEKRQASQPFKNPVLQKRASKFLNANTESMLPSYPRGSPCLIPFRVCCQRFGHSGC